MPRASQVKKALQLKYNRGEFANRQALLDYGAEQGWTLWRNGQTYVTFGNKAWDGTRKRARIIVDFGDEAEFQSKRAKKQRLKRANQAYYKRGFFAREPYSAAALDIRWIYVILAKSETGIAAYIGQASRLSRRLKDHLRNANPEKSSGPLQSWAAGQGASLQIVVVDCVAGALGKAEATRRATHLEGLWTERARLNGALLLGVESWGQFPPQAADADFKAIWESAMDAAQPIEMVLAGELDFEAVCASGARYEAVRAKFMRVQETD